MLTFFLLTFSVGCNMTFYKLGDTLEEKDSKPINDDTAGVIGDEQVADGISELSVSDTRYYVDANRDGSLDSKYCPVVAVYPNGRFIFMANLFEGMDYLEGKYEISSSIYKFTVTDIYFSGFTGDDVTEFTMSLNNNVLVISDITAENSRGIGWSGIGSTFILSNAKPEQFKPDKSLKALQ